MQLVHARSRVLILLVMVASVIVGLQPPVLASASGTSTAGPDVQARPDAVSALLAAKAEGHRVEITGDETATSTTWMNPDGSLTTDQAAGPVRVQNADGSWTPLDLDLAQNADGTYGPVSAPATVGFSGGGDKSLATVTNLLGQSFGLGWASKLPAPTVSGGTAVYQLNSTTQLVLATTALGFTVHVVLSAPPSSAPTLKLPLTLNKLAVSQASDGELVVSSASTGKTRWRARPFVMWDSQIDDAGNPSNVAPVPYTVTNTSSGRQELDLSPAMTFLTDPSTVYPVTIDPDVASATPIGSTYVYGTNDNKNPGNTTPEWTDYKLPVGVFSTNTYDSYVDFDTSAFAGKDVLTASLSLYQYQASGCSSNTLSAYPTTSAPTSSTVWANKPAWNTSIQYSGSATLCSANHSGSIDVSGMAQGWANTKDGIPSDGVALVAGSGQRTFCSLNPSSASTSCKTAATEPVLSYTYRSYPGVPTGLTVSPSTLGPDGTEVPTSTPTLTATPMQPDGGSVRLDVDLEYDPAYGQSGPVSGWSSGQPSWVPAGTPQLIPIASGALFQGNHLEWKARTFDGTNYGPWSAFQMFTVDMSAPPAPTVSCTGFPQNVWTNAEPQIGDDCTLSDTDSDLGGFKYSFDTPTPATKIDVQPGSQSATVAIPNGHNMPLLANGWHTLNVEAFNLAGRPSALVTYAFGVGIGGLSKPYDQQSTQQAVTVSSGSDPNKTAETLNYRLGVAGAWTAIPTGDVTIVSSGAHPASWPLTGTSGAYPDLTWDAASTVAGAGGSDGPVQVQACYTGGVDPDGCSTATTVILDRTSFSAGKETQPIGPGDFAPGTGDFEMAATDVSIAEPFGSLSVGRDLTTLAPATITTGAAGVLGPAWRFQIPGPDFAGAPELTPAVSAAQQGFATLTDEQGVTYTYTTTDTGYPYTFHGIGEAADGSVLTSTTQNDFTLKDTDGTVTAWHQQNGVWQVTSVTEPGVNGTTSYSFDTSGRLSYLLAPHAQGISCGRMSSNPGCRELDFTYAATTTATSDSPSGWGDYANQLSAVTYTAYDPASSAMSTTTVAQYAYDTHGLLRGEWDPRVSPTLETTYGYDSNNRLTTLTPPGLNPWTLTYDTAGRLVSVSRTDPVNGTATQAIAYNVPLSGSGAPVDLSAATAATWDETQDLPYGTGTAIFPADHVPATGSNGDYAPTSGDWPYGTITYRDVNGREVNSADYGAGQWLVSTSQYDVNGNPVWSLTPGNRAQALTPTADTDPDVAALTDSAQRANALATLNTYTDDGTVDGQNVDLTDSYGPTSPMVLDNGTTVDARSHTHYTFDENNPGGGPYHLITTTTTGAYYDDGTGNGATDHDVRTSYTGYDPIKTGDTSGWSLRKPTSQTVVIPGGSNIVTKTRYDVDGNVIESRMPMADTAGDDAYTTKAYYYASDGNSGRTECNNTAKWAGLLCWSGPASQPAGQTVPSTSTTYNYLSEPTVVTETSGATIRTTTTTYDAVGREASVVVNDTTSGVTQIPTVSYGYDPTTGLPTTTSTPSQTITAGYDALGRVTSYTAPAASGTNTTTTGYDIDGRPISVNDGKGTTTYSYDGTDSLGNTEHRGLLTSENTGMGSNPSSFAGAYGADGNLVSESYPASVVATSHYDNNGNLTSLGYTAGGSAIAQFTQAANAFGEIRAQSSPESTQTLTYDADARLAQVADTGDGTCVTRAYSFDADTNRTGLSTYPADTSGNCSTSTTPATASWTHDAADRTTNTGYSYDPMGRTLTLPGSDTSVGGSGTVALSYFANDMVHSENDGTSSDTFTLDPANRLITTANSTTGITTTNVYADPSDSPAWQSQSNGSWSRNATDLGGNLAAIQTGTAAGTATLQLVNPHGDVVATLTDPTSGDATMTAYFESTEFGVPRAADTTVPAHYGWLGGKRRDSGDLAGLVLMGERIYDPYAGRFASVDPVPGGSANDYDYCDQDPVNGIDLEGTQNLHDGGIGLPHRHKKRHRPWYDSVYHYAVSDAIHGPGHLAHDVHNDVIKPIGRDVAKPIWHHRTAIGEGLIVAGLACTGWGMVMDTAALAGDLSAEGLSESLLEALARKRIAATATGLGVSSILGGESLYHSAQRRWLRWWG